MPLDYTPKTVAIYIFFLAFHHTYIFPFTFFPFFSSNIFYQPEFLLRKGRMNDRTRPSFVPDELRVRPDDVRGSPTFSRFLFHVF